MGFRLLQTVYDKQPEGLSQIEVHILAYLAFRANDDTGETWPSINTIVRQTRAHRASVMRAEKTFENKGWLRTQREPGKVNRYFLDLSSFQSPTTTSRLNRPVFESDQSPREISGGRGERPGESPRATGVVASSDPNIKEQSENNQKEHSIIERSERMAANNFSDGEPKPKATSKTTTPNKYDKAGIELLQRLFPEETDTFPDNDAVKDLLRRYPDGHIDWVAEIIESYPMQPNNEHVHKKWAKAILVEIAEGPHMGGYLLGKVWKYGAVNPKKCYALDKFMSDGHYREVDDWYDTFSAQIRAERVAVPADDDEGDTFKVEDVNDNDGLS